MMAVDLMMPKLGLTMEEGKVARWLVAGGDRVEKGQIVLEVETDKAVVEVEATASGVMGPLLIDEGQTVPLNTLLARIYGLGEEVSPGKQVEQRIPRSDEVESGEKPVTRVTPLARRVAEEEGIDLSSIPVRRSSQRVRVDDVRAVQAKRDSNGKRRRQRVFSSPRARKQARELAVNWRTLPGSGPRGRVVEKDVLRAAQGARTVARAG